jgi:hypothetical protein
MFFFELFSQDKVIKVLQQESQSAMIKVNVDTSSKRWKRGLLYSLTFSQASLSNWSAGGDNFSLSIGSLLNTYLNYKEGKSSWENSFDFNLGYVNTTSLGGRKNDDRFDLVSKYGYSISKDIDLASLVNLRSGFFKGYTYQGNQRNFTSNFLSPGYLLVSQGFDYRQIKNLSLFFSPVTARLVMVTDPVLSVKGLYGVTSGEKLNLELGAYSTINFTKEITTNVTYRGRLDLFTNYRNNPQNVDIFMTNLLNVKLSKIFNLTWGVDLIYDDDAKLFGPNKNSPSLQFKSLIGLGLLFKR